MKRFDENKGFQYRGRGRGNSSSRSSGGLGRGFASQPGQPESNSSQGQRESKNSGSASGQYKTGNHKRDLNNGSFGFSRLYSLTTTPSEKVILYIWNDLQQWKILLDFKDLKSDWLYLIITILSEKVCDEVSLRQQQVNILSTCCQCKVFTQKLVNLIMEIVVGNYPAPSSSRRADKESQVEHKAETVLTNIFQFVSFVFKTMPATMQDHSDLKVAIHMGINAASKIEKSDLVAKYTQLCGQVEDMIKQRRARGEAIKRQKRFGFSEQDHREMDKETPPENIRDICVIPSIQELKQSSEVFLRPNKTTGAYNNSEHYCDVQFRLFREDFVQPLRKGIKSFLENKNDYLKKGRMPPGELRLYKGVTFIQVTKEFDTLVHKLQLSPQKYQRIRWNTSKRLLYGALILLTTEEKPFEKENTHFGVIFSRNVSQLEKGIVTVTWEGLPPTYTANEYLMFESEVYLESRIHTLETLKKLNLDTFPMKKFIVDAESTVGAPQYLQGEDMHLNVVLANGQKRAIFSLEESEWPSAEDFGLDANQYTAFHAALTKEFAIIQGPPGTGKTFLGLKIAEVLLRNEVLWRETRKDQNPITVVCYTNFALDQFLEGIVKLYEKANKQPDILRLGGSSKSDIMKEYTLARMRVRKRMNRPHVVHKAEMEARSRLNELEEERAKGMDQVIELQNLQGIVNFEKLAAFNKLEINCPKVLLNQFRKLYWFGVNPTNINRPDFRSEGWVRKYFRVKSKPENFSHRIQRTNIESEDLEEIELYDQEEIFGDRILDDIILEAEAATKKSIRDSLWNQQDVYLPWLSIFSFDEEIRKLQGQETTKVNRKGKQKKEKAELVPQFHVVENRKRVFQRMFQLYHDKLLDLPDVSVLVENIRKGALEQTEIEKFTISQKWAIYFSIVEEFRAEIAKRVADTERNLSMSKKLLADIKEWGDSFIAQDCRVVGLTTTGAAKYNNLLRRIKSKIVIVEEAAQVFEAQVVTCITQSCQHLIMIGDHKQLQPNPNVYELARTYNLNLSLFERMLNNNLHCYQLKVQHRMRPDIADLIVGPIYGELLNADSVSDPELYPDVKGVTKNVFFVSHSHPEYCDNDSRSRSNMHEMKFISGLCRYLILQGYKPSQISVLTTYKGQMFNLRSELRNISTCADVRVSSVDDFQGQENDIILVSLVRSNEEGKVGFVGIDNRICVALSRAKQGLFVIGNMPAMVSNSTAWAQIKAKLDDKEFIGEELELACQIHGNRSMVKCGLDFLEKSPDGGCTEICNMTLPCTHICKRLCHAIDREPENHKCEEPCLKTCENRLHSCKGFCYENPCPPCYELVQRTLNCEFKHPKTMRCYSKVEDELCHELVKRIPICKQPEHIVELACHVKIVEYKCQFQVIKELECKHSKEMKCFEDPSTKQCKVLVTQEIPNCGHSQEEQCYRWNNPENIVCEFLVPKEFELCEHIAKVKCGEKDKEIVCQENCSLRLPCGHACIKKCHGDKDPDHLTVKCKKPCNRKCPQGHKCFSNHPCFKSKSCPPCNKILRDQLLSCGHNQTLVCYEFTGNSYKCTQSCKHLLDCGHPCKSMCFESCGPCKIQVPKIAPCNHSQQVECSKPAKKENCMDFVSPRNIPACGHNQIKFPCKLEYASAEELAKHCTQPCTHTYISGDETGCKHNCKGTCSSCKYGRLHLKCQEKCGRSLVCGHRCEVNCSKACPPCQKPIQVKCTHSTWKGLCGEIWPECSEPCEWSCEHQQCTKLCGEPCNREPCDEPCDKALKCGHSCIGFCGEPCPLKCRVCDKEELQEEMEMLAVEDDIDAARFVLLEDCPGGHCIEVNALQNLLSKSASDEIGLKSCYIHLVPIINCRRFGSRIQQSYQDVLAVKVKARGNLQVTKILQDRWIKRLSQQHDIITAQMFPEICQMIWKLLVNEASLENGTTVVKAKEMGEVNMKSLDFIAQCVSKPAKELMNLHNTNKLAKTEFQLVVIEHAKIFETMLVQHPLSYQEMLDFNGELDRLDLYKQLLVRKSLPQCNPNNGYAYSVYEMAEAFFTSVLPLTMKRKQDFIQALKLLDDRLSSGLGITEREKQEIVTAMGMSRGHWFKCPNGHIYAIGDCGGANQRGVCNVCKSPIGGMSHQLERGNQLAPEMDRATGPAWPTALMRY